MKMPAFNKNLLLNCFMICALTGWGFIYYQKLQIAAAFDDALQKQHNLQAAMKRATDISTSIQRETHVHKNAIDSGFFKRLRPRELKRVIETLALECGINQIFMKFSPLKYDIQSLSMRPIKLTFQTALDEDVFHLIDTLQHQNIGLIDIKELNMFKGRQSSSEHNLLNVELHIEILNFHEQVQS